MGNTGSCKNGLMRRACLTGYGNIRERWSPKVFGPGVAGCLGTQLELGQKARNVLCGEAGLEICGVVESRHSQ